MLNRSASLPSPLYLPTCAVTEKFVPLPTLEYVQPPAPWLASIIHLNQFIMALQKSTIQISGKLGNIVGYTVANAAKPGSKGAREHRATIANPKTTSQASQRMRMKPAINFYQGLASLLDHSWQGVKYGARSRAKFMQLALSPTLQGIPFVDKGETRFIPGEYPVSLGQVGINTSDITFDGGGGANALLRWPSQIDPGDFGTLTQSSWGQYSQELIKQYVGLEDGDEITCIGVYKEGDMYLPIHRYFVVDVNSLSTISDVMLRSQLFIGVDGILLFNAVYSQSNGITYMNANFVAGAVIVSRHPSKNSSTWLRTSSSMVVSDAVKAEWMSAQRLAAARATYQNKSYDLTSDWLLNQSENLANEGALNPGTTYTLVSSSLTVGGTTGVMAQLSVDGATPKVILQQFNRLCYYGTLVNGTVNFSTSNQITGDLGETQFISAEAAKAADRSHTYNLLSNDDMLPIETPGV